MNKKVISVIIPMYNEEESIIQCLTTLQNQSTQDFHVIFIDDGSTDNTCKLLNSHIISIQPEFTFEVLYQKNSGAAKARENGIHKCTSEYIIILDCDDVVSQDFIALTLESIHSSKADISLPNMEIQQSDHSFKSFAFYDNRAEYTGKESLQYSLGRWKVHGVMCAKKSIFLKSYKTYKTFNPTEANYINNDEVISRLNFFYADNVVKNKGVYFYLNNTNSTTKKINPNTYLMCKNAQILFELFGENLGVISTNAQQELIETMWRNIKYAMKYKSSLSNITLWKKQLLETLNFINNNQTKMKISFKNRLRIMKSHIYLLFL